MFDCKSIVFLRGRSGNQKSVKHVVFDRFFMKRECLGAGRLYRKPCPVRRFDRFDRTSGTKTSCFTRLLRFVGVRCRRFDAPNEREPHGVCETDPPQTPSGAVFAADRAPGSQTAFIF